MKGAPNSRILGSPWFPDLVLKGCLYDDRDLTGEVLIHYLEEEIGDHTIGVRWKLIVLDAMGVDIALLDLVATDNWHPQSFSEFSWIDLFFPDPGRPVTIMHLGLLPMLLNTLPSLNANRRYISVYSGDILNQMTFQGSKSIYLLKSISMLTVLCQLL